MNRKGSGGMQSNSKKAWLYLLPSLVLLGAFLVYPLIDVFIYSLEECYNFPKTGRRTAARLPVRTG